MGWNTWNTFACNISKHTILSAARAIKAENLDKYGYNYVIIDDCWQADRCDPETKVLPANPDKSPGGLKKVVDEIKSLGLKARIYSSAGIMTCGHHIGSLGYEDVDAKAWSDDGFEYLKYDNCDIYPSFNKDDDRCPCTDITMCDLQGFHCSIAKILDFAAGLGQKAYPGAWNDLDMLEVGNRGLSLDESLVHFSMWAMVKSPLILGNGLTKMTNQTRAIIKNKHVIDISQDPKGSPAVRLWKKQHNDGNTQLWKIALINGTYAVAAINVSESEKKMEISMDDVFFDEYLEGEDLKDDAWNAYGLWKGVDFSKDPCKEEEVGMEQMKVGGRPFKGSLGEVTVAKHGNKLFKLTPAGSGSGSSQQRRSGRMVWIRLRENLQR
ncbi:probable alpha-galactosidase [Ustilago sp. UG-2017b]|nr:probable alpha-galactosidase [Ustilago sp. UG-2017b]